MKLSFSKKVLISAIVTLFIVLFLDTVFTNLLLKKIVSINDKVRQIDISSQERLKELNLKDSTANTVEEREKLGEYFVGPGNAETVEFTKYLEDLAAEMNLTQRKTLDYEAVNEPGLSDFISAIRFKFNVSGKWSDVYGFLYAIEKLPKIVSLNSVSLNLNSDNKTWSADLDFLVVKLKN